MVKVNRWKALVHCHKNGFPPIYVKCEKDGKVRILKRGRWVEVPIDFGMLGSWSTLYLYGPEAVSETIFGGKDNHSGVGIEAAVLLHAMEQYCRLLSEYERRAMKYAESVRARKEALEQLKAKLKEIEEGGGL